MSRNPEQTIEIGSDIASKLRPGSVVGLVGPLGAGKTVMVRGICNGLGYDGNITSPTFSIVNIYSGRSEIYHIDCYRLEGIHDLEDIGYETFFFSETGICLVEWADRVADAIRNDALIVSMEIIDETKRRIVIGDRSLLRSGS